MTCFQYSKNDVFVCILKASVNLTTRSTVKNSHIEHDLVFIFKNSRINDTHSQGYYCQAKNHCSLYNFSRAGLSVSLNMQSVRLFQYKYSASRDIPVPTIQSVGIFQYKIFSQYGYFSTHNQPVGIFQYQLFSQQGYSSTQYSVSRDIPVQHIQSVGICQYNIFSQQGYAGTTYSVSMDIPVENNQSVEIFHYNIFSQYGYSSTQ